MARSGEERGRERREREREGGREREPEREWDRDTSFVTLSNQHEHGMQNDAFDFASGLLMHHFEDIRKPIDDAAARRNRPKFR